MLYVSYIKDNKKKRLLIFNFLIFYFVLDYLWDDGYYILLLLLCATPLI